MATCPCGYRFGCPCGCEACPHCDGPETLSRVVGAIGRGLVDAQSYRAQLDGLWREVVAALPDD